MILNHIVAHGADYAIGKNNQLLWNYPEDLKYFKDQTMNKIMIMGRKTFESILEIAKKPLPGRYHIVISSNDAPSLYERVFYVKSVEEALTKAQELIIKENWSSDVMIVGGASIYQQTLILADKLLVTRIPHSYEDADTHYPSDYSQYFHCVKTVHGFEQTEISFETWVKK